MNGGPLEQQYLKLLRRKKTLIIHGSAYASLERGIRTLASLAHRELPKADAAKAIVASSVAIHLALSAAWDEGNEVLRRSIADTHGPVGRFHSPSGLAALVDHGEYLLQSLGQLSAGKAPRATRSRHYPRASPPSAATVRVRHDAILEWLEGFFVDMDIDGLGSFALQDLTRQLPVVPTTKERKRVQRRAQALRRVFPRGDLDRKAKEVLLLLEQAARMSPPVQPTQQMLVRELDGKFKLRKLGTLTADLSVLGFIARGEATEVKEAGFVLTFAGAALLRFNLKPAK